jgi:hypothetical protein
MCLTICKNIYTKHTSVTKTVYDETTADCTFLK